MVFAGYTVAMRRMPTALTPLAQFVGDERRRDAGAAAVLRPSEVLARGGLPPITLATLPWLAVLVFVAGIGAFLGYNLSLMRNGPVLTAASISLTPIYAAGMAIGADRRASWPGITPRRWRWWWAACC